VAVYGDASDAKTVSNNMFTEKEWNTTSSVDHQPYSYSKVVAEKKAWEMQEKQDRWDLTVINPAFVMGPGINPNATSESFTFFRRLINGESKMGVPYLEFGVVDVRDLATAHYNAGFMENAKGRHIISAESVSMLKMAEIIRDKVGDDYPLPKKELPKFLVYLAAPFAGLSLKFVKNNVGLPLRFDNSKSRNELGINYRPMEETIIDLFEQLK